MIKRDYQGYPIEFKYEDGQGRYTVATRDLDIGEVVLVSQSYISLATFNLKRFVCHTCMKQHQSQLVVKCNACNQVSWCNEQCRNENQDAHNHYECIYFKKVNNIKVYNQQRLQYIEENQIQHMSPTLHTLDDDTQSEIRMALALIGRFISIKYLNKDFDNTSNTIQLDSLSNSLNEINDQLNNNQNNNQQDSVLDSQQKRLQQQRYPIIKGDFQDVLDLVENKITKEDNIYAYERIELIVDIITRLLMDIWNSKQPTTTSQNTTTISINHLTKEDMDIVISNIRPLICKARCNQFGVWTKRDKCIGTSVVPSASLFNHSCVPNVIDVRGTTLLEFKTLHPIKKGTPLCITYLSLNQTFESRQQDLKYSYFFDCLCPRCTDTTDVIDNWLSQFYCPKSRCEGNCYLLDKEKDINQESNEITLTCNYCSHKIKLPLDSVKPPKILE